MEGDGDIIYMESIKPVHGPWGIVKGQPMQRQNGESLKHWMARKWAALEYEKEKRQQEVLRPVQEEKEAVAVERKPVFSEEARKYQERNQRSFRSGRKSTYHGEEFGYKKNLHVERDYFDPSVNIDQRALFSKKRAAALDTEKEVSKKLQTDLENQLEQAKGAVDQEQSTADLLEQRSDILQKEKKTLKRQWEQTMMRKAELAERQLERIRKESKLERQILQRLEAARDAVREDDDGDFI